jgi:HEPN domain-containing protein
MALPLEQSRLLLCKAQDDWVALQVLLGTAKVADEIIGFHAQQVVEKAIKAVLSYKSISYRRTHDLAELIDLLSDNGVTIPAELEETVDLTPFAVEFRYDFLPPEGKSSDGINRDQLRDIMQKTLDWVQSVIV